MLREEELQEKIKELKRQLQESEDKLKRVSKEEKKVRK